MTESTSDDKQERVAAAIQKADSGSNHQAGMDGDDASTADRTAGTADRTAGTAVEDDHLDH